jgi:uncharacterized protein YhhL (DUF1145 family)
VFFGGGLLLLINLFLPFLPDGIYYVVVFSVAGAFLLLMVASKLMSVVHAAKRDDAPRQWSRR